MECISYTAHKTNEFVLSKTQKSRMIQRDIENRQLKFFGHVVRKAELEKKTISPDTLKANDPEEERETNLDGISEKLGRSRAECIRIARKRKERRFLWKACL